MRLCHVTLGEGGSIDDLVVDGNCHCLRGTSRVGIGVLRLGSPMAEQSVPLEEGIVLALLAASAGQEGLPANSCWEER